MSSWPLPCSVEEYPKILVELLNKIRNEKVTLEELSSYISEQKGLSDKWVVNSLRCSLLYTGLVEIKEDNTLRLTELGEEYLSSRDNRIVIQALIENIWGVREIMLLLLNRTLKVSDMYSALKKIGAPWKTQDQIGFRLRWLRAFGAVRRKGIYYELTEVGKDIARSLENFQVRMESLTPEEITKSAARLEEADHESIKRKLIEIGEIKGYYASEEYPMERFRLDVVWKRVPTGNPVKVFEVQIRGNFYEALAKLKHAWDIWNSGIFLITTEEYEPLARWLIDGSFHEIKNVIKIVNWKRINSYYKLIKELKNLEEDIGF